MAVINTADMLNLYDMTGNAVSAYEMAFEFAQKNIAPLNAGLEESNTFPAHLWKAMGNQGLLSANAPKEFGGEELGMLTQIAITAAISYHSGSVALSQLAHVDLCMGRIIHHGTQEQKNKYLPGLINGDEVGALAITEPNAGSDAMSAATTAVEDGDNVILNGGKTFITNGGKANTIVTYAQTEKRKLSTYIVDGNAPGFIPGGKINKIGMRGSETYQINFDNCIVPQSNMLGEKHKGGNILMHGFNTERLVLSAAAVGIAERSLEAALQYTTEREQFGKKLNDNQGLMFQLMDCYSKLNMVKNYIYTTAAAYDRNPDSLTNVNSASVFLEAGLISEHVCLMSLKHGGGMGYTKDMLFGQNLLDVLLYGIGGGTENIKRVAMGKVVLAKAHEQYALKR